jgi:hypothetical protein
MTPALILLLAASLFLPVGAIVWIAVEVWIDWRAARRERRRETMNRGRTHA